MSVTRLKFTTAQRLLELVGGNPDQGSKVPYAPATPPAGHCTGIQFDGVRR